MKAEEHGKIRGKNGRDDRGHFAPGNVGRPKGSRNRFTDLKQNYLAALEHLGKPHQQKPGNEGLSPGTAYLVDFAEKHPKAFVMGLVKLLPSTSKDELKVQGVNIPRLCTPLSPEDRERRDRIVARFRELCNEHGDTACQPPVKAR